jgi:hypothetical protein
MITVKISTTSPEWPLERQTPGEKGRWGNCQFIINQEIEECDYWVVYEDVKSPEKVRCASQNTLLVTGEPPSVKTYSEQYLDLFGTILTCHRNLHHKDVINRQQALPWMVGGKFIKETKSWKEDFTKNYDELIQTDIFNKDRLASVILSRKTGTPGHRKRVKFLKYLKKELRGDLDIFGVGYNEIEDKWDGISPCKYYFAIENSCYPDYWTEKLSDCFLAGAYPLYYGCPNIFDYFPQNCLKVIDINNPKKAISDITSAINQNAYENNVGHIQHARNLILNEYNLFPTLEKIIVSRYQKKEGEVLEILPYMNYNPVPYRIKIKQHAGAIYKKYLAN